MRFKTTKYTYKIYNGNKRFSIYSTSDELAQYLIDIENTHNYYQWVLIRKKKTTIDINPKIFEKDQELFMLDNLENRLLKKK